IDWFSIDWGTRDIYNWSPANESRPIYTRLLSVPEYKDQFTFHLTGLLNGFMNNPGYSNYIDGIKSMIDPYALADNYRTLDYGYSASDYHNSFTAASGGHVKYGLKPYVNARKSSALSQAIVNNIKPVIFQPHFSNPALNEPIIFTVEVEDEVAPSVNLHYRFNQGNWQNALMTDNGMNGDQQAGDGFYATTLSGFANAGLLEYYIEATDAQNQISRKPKCEAYSIELAKPGPPLVINELMADNETFKTDEEGEFDDWIEIYNNGNEPIFMGDFYLSDDPDKPDKWPMPAQNIYPGQFMIIWADDDGHQGNFHANFKLSKSGETLGIYNSQANGYSMIDQVSFGELNTDHSYARVPNGTGEFAVISTPTFKANNGSSGFGIPIPDGFYIFPNPFTSQLQINIPSDKPEFLQIEIISLNGQLVHNQKLYTTPNLPEYTIQTQNLAPGIYIALIRDRANDFQILTTQKLVKI
ncbi:MAG: lamin tail domain-containing protein, partial [Bacteroidetes bacterium]|nr:lamin tail domain-containing protein [Bacteroidota bacterium]